MKRNTRTFTDIDMSFLAIPSTGDISLKIDENAIKQSVKNLIMTNNFERKFHPEIGSQVNALLFENFSPMLQSMLERAIINTVENFEPRVQLLGVDVQLNPDNVSVYVSVFFKIVNTETPLNVNITLQRTR